MMDDKGSGDHRMKFFAICRKYPSITIKFSGTLATRRRVASIIQYIIARRDYTSAAFVFLQFILKEEKAII